MYKIFLQLYCMKWVPGPTTGNAQLIRQNDFSFTEIKLVYCLTRKTLKCNSLVQKICLFPQKETSHCKKQLSAGSPGTQAVYFWRPLLLEKWDPFCAYEG